MQRLDRLISGIMKGRARVLWEGVFWGGTRQAIIGYGDLSMPRPRGKTVDWFMVGLALQKRHISLYVNAVEDGRYIGAKYRAQLGKVKVGAASISFARLDDVNLDALRDVLRAARAQLPRAPRRAAPTKKIGPR